MIPICYYVCIVFLLLIILIYILGEIVVCSSLLLYSFDLGISFPFTNYIWESRYIFIAAEFLTTLFPLVIVPLYVFRMDHYQYIYNGLKTDIPRKKNEIVNLQRQLKRRRSNSVNQETCLSVH